MFLAVGCGGRGSGGDSDSNSKVGENKQLQAMEEINYKLIEIMQQANLIPVIKKLTAEGGTSEVQGAEEQEQQEQGEGAQQGERQTQQGGKAQQEQQRFELTFDETILGQVLQREIEAEAEPSEDGGQMQQPPNSVNEIWEQIKLSITVLHEQWNNLEPLLVQRNLAQVKLNDFEEKP
ncbi:MAG: hypothetical protein GX764_04910 [Firmicutes bacterium]|nr:hypothetical protein [Bacillota bacterium]